MCIINGMRIANDNSSGLSVSEKMEQVIANNIKRITVFTGGNGSGKTRLLKLIEKELSRCKKGNKRRIIEFLDDNKKVIKDLRAVNVVNYSHFDGKLQKPDDFSRYVIGRAKEKLLTYKYEETALNALLYLYSLAQGICDNKQADAEALGLILNELAQFGIDVKTEEQNSGECKIKFFDRDWSIASLSPGQIYIIRAIIGCQVFDKNGSYIFLFDEPETHLHADVLIRILNKFIDTFKNSQFFISTHSIELISALASNYSEDLLVLNLDRGMITNYLRSNSEVILSGLLGTDSSERSAIYRLFESPGQYACVEFCIECLSDPTVVSEVNKDDPQTQMISEPLSRESVVVDYGCGTGRILECLCAGEQRLYKYFGYDKSQACIEECIKAIDMHSIDGQAFSDYQSLHKACNGADYVLAVNLLHEISPSDWKEEFNRMADLLNDNGKLIIVEQEQLTMGEKPYQFGYLVLTSHTDDKPNAAYELFGSKNVQFCRMHDKPNIIRYIISKSGLKNVSNESIIRAVGVLREESINVVKEIKNRDKNNTDYKHGMALAFWLNQYANATLIENDLEEDHV